MKSARLIILTVLTVLATIVCRAQSDTTIYFVNIYPGHNIYELEGHSAIIADIKGRGPVAYNFGVFDFDAPNFVYRFVKGETDYMAVAQPAEPFLYHYTAAGRRIVAHELNLDANQKKDLLDRLNTNIRPENRVYRYNYVKDNCATRPLAAVEASLGDSIILAPALAESQSFAPVTFRNIMRWYHRNYPWYQFGIDLALGSGIDYPITRREMAFAPAELDGMLPGAQAGGKKVVAKSIVLNDVAPDAAIDGPTPWLLGPMSVSLLILVLAVYFTLKYIKRGRLTRWFDSILFALLGLTGCLLTFLIFVSVHEATSPNWLFAWLNPLCLIPTIFIWIKKARTFLVWYQMTNFVVLIALCVAWHWLPQSANPAFLPLIGAEMLRSFACIYIYFHPKRTKIAS